MSLIVCIRSLTPPASDLIPSRVSRIGSISTHFGRCKAWGSIILDVPPAPLTACRAFSKSLHTCLNSLEFLENSSLILRGLCLSLPIRAPHPSHFSVSYKALYTYVPVCAPHCTEYIYIDTSRTIDSVVNMRQLHNYEKFFTALRNMPLSKFYAMLKAS